MSESRELTGGALSPSRRLTRLGYSSSARVTSQTPRSARRSSSKASGPPRSSRRVSLSASSRRHRGADRSSSAPAHRALRDGERPIGIAPARRAHSTVVSGFSSPTASGAQSSAIACESSSRRGHSLVPPRGSRLGERDRKHCVDPGQPEHARTLGERPARVDDVVDQKDGSSVGKWPARRKRRARWPPAGRCSRASSAGAVTRVLTSARTNGSPSELASRCGESRARAQDA